MTACLQQLRRVLSGWFAVACALAVIWVPTVSADSIILQSTTSTANSGLYEAILPQFTERTGIAVRVVAVGTGQALKNARNGDGDVLLVHAKSAELKFVADGYGVARHDVMYNDFVLVGPTTDPAEVGAARSVAFAFRNIAKAQAVFASRGDNSGTHQRELALWRRANVAASEASGSWYRETGSGMGATLNLAAGMGAYTLTDRGTWLSFGNRSGLRVLFEGSPELLNQYGVILVNPKRHPHVNDVAGNRFIKWLLGKEGQRAIATFKLAGKPLFFANAKP
jgi:tungstate transport system substrate-binding protein